MGEMQAGTLWIVATPIGNLDDRAPRVVAVLRGVAVVACEDTRHSATLFARCGIATPSVPLHEHNEREATERLLARLQAGDSVALVSDAGTPLVSDPGYRLVAAARAAGVPVVSEIDVGCAALPDTRYAVITGTNGKTTTTALTGHLLRATGRRVGVAGNISPAALAALMDAEDAQTLPDVWVLELSSFQLEPTATLNPAAATVLNVSDDHLDRYAGIDDYAATKARIFSGEGVLMQLVARPTLYPELIHVPLFKLRWMLKES